jgi:hypothetical protein
MRPAAATMAATLAAYGSVLWPAHLRVDAVVLAVVLAVTLGSPMQRADLTDRGIGLALVPAVTVGVTALNPAKHEVVGSVLFVVAVSATIWVRRWGPRFTIAGALATAPLLAVLIHPVSGTPALWTAVVAVIAYAWMAVAHLPPAPTFTHRSHPRVSTSMAVQMGVALATAFVAGHVVFGAHWSWVVLTAFVVCSGNRGRGDVLLKGVLRVAGAVVGTGVATVLAGVFGPADPWQVVAIFVLLAAGTFLRTLSYAYWAACITAALAFLYGYFGQTAVSLLFDRLGGILLGGVLGVAASWFVMPLRNEVLPAWLARACATVCRPIRHGLQRLSARSGRPPS